MAKIRADNIIYSEKAQDVINQLKTGSKEQKDVSNGIDLIRENILIGLPEPIPKDYKGKITNYFMLKIGRADRLMYTIFYVVVEEKPVKKVLHNVKIMEIFIEHKEYSQRLKYKRKSKA